MANNTQAFCHRPVAQFVPLKLEKYYNKKTGKHRGQAVLTIGNGTLLNFCIAIEKYFAVNFLYFVKIILNDFVKRWLSKGCPISTGLWTDRKTLLTNNFSTLKIVVF